jgi:hypothetical protein
MSLRPIIVFPDPGGETIIPKSFFEAIFGIC